MSVELPCRAEDEPAESAGTLVPAGRHESGSRHPRCRAAPSDSHRAEAGTAQMVALHVHIAGQTVRPNNRVLSNPGRKDRGGGGAAGIVGHQTSIDFICHRYHPIRKIERRLLQQPHNSYLEGIFHYLHLDRSNFEFDPQIPPLTIPDVVDAKDFQCDKDD